MNKKENRMLARQAAEKEIRRDEQNRRLEYAAANPTPAVLKELHTTLCGLDAEAVSASRAKHGSNKVTREKKKSLARRLADAFINPFTAILSFWPLYPQRRTWFSHTFLCLEACRRILTA